MQPCDVQGIQSPTHATDAASARIATTSEGICRTSTTAGDLIHVRVKKRSRFLRSPFVNVQKTRDLGALNERMTEYRRFLSSKGEL